jgi:hypothetical protein
MMMKVADSSETLISTNQTAQPLVLGDHNVNIHRPENFVTHRTSRFVCGIRSRTQTVLSFLHAATQQPGFHHEIKRCSRTQNEMAFAFVIFIIIYSS